MTRRFVPVLPGEPKYAPRPVQNAKLPYLSGYPATLQDQVRPLLASGELARRLAAKYPDQARIKSDHLLVDYVLELKNQFLKRSPPLGKICFDDKISSLRGALGLHTHISRVQGSRLQAKNELRIASLLRAFPHEFLHMVVVHELAHLREKDHNKAFYQLCCHMEPRYHELELDLRLYLTAKESAAPSQDEA